ncbi:uncharacterized protein [Triticum aestivum]|uniref:uncharacterized protein n=1 Tax=Triticum aestivum TaxID=4565 RepID=UPI001D00EA8A|nr:uncharacterized protein LOC123153965 [Triticum aestivum]
MQGSTMDIFKLPTINRILTDRQLASSNFDSKSRFSWETRGRPINRLVLSQMYYNYREL